METVVYYLFLILSALIALTVHEFSHGYIAYKLGDPTARSLGRLTLNPMKHIDPIGALCMVFFKFGWARPVPINPRYFKKPKRDFALVAMGGPLSNFILAIFSALFHTVLLFAFSNYRFSSEFGLSIVQNILDFLFVFHIINLGFMIFNLIPIPPLDGSRILNVILPDKVYFKIMKYERIIYYVFLGWLLIGDVICDVLMKSPLIAGSPLLSGVISILSLSDMISAAINAISGLIFNFFNLFFR